MTPDQDFGPKPTLEWLPVARMIVDPAYQRDTNSERSRRLIAQIAAEFRWARLQPLVVTPRDGGEYAILDGQHRRAGAIKAGIGALPCMIIPAGSIAAEADAFVRLNVNRVKVDPYRMYWSRVVAGDADAVLTKSVCDRAGVTICKYPKDRNTIAPNETLALEAIRTSIKRFEPPSVILALSAMVEAYRDTRAQLRAGLIRGVCQFVFNHPMPVDRERLALALQNVDAEDIEIAARAARRDTGESTDVIIARTIAAHYQAVYFPRGAAPAMAAPAPAPKPIVQAKVPIRPALIQPPRAAIAAVGASVSVVPPANTGIMTCQCKRQFRPAFAGQKSCNLCGDKYAAGEPIEAAE